MPSDPVQRSPLPRTLTLLLSAALALPSCKLVQGVADAPGEIVGAATGAKKTPPAVDLEAAREAAVRLADRIVLQIDSAAYRFAQAEDSQAGREQALAWRIAAAERAYACATEERPVAALVNLVALAAFESRIHDAYWSTQWGAADQPMAETWRGLEEDGLAAAARCLPPDHVRSMREMLAKWDQSVVDADTLAASGTPRFEDLAGAGTESSGRANLFGALGLNPLDSIEPAAREVARARELAERGLFLAQRAPRLLALRIERLTLQVTKQPDVQTVLQSVERTSLAADSVAATAAALPERLRAEGDALLQRTSAELSAQRAGLVADLERTSAPTHALLAQAQQTIDAATRLAQALDTTTRTVDTFVAHVAPPEPAGAAAPPAAKPADGAPEETPGKPFDPVEYTALAAQITAGLQELNTTAASFDQSLPKVRQAVDAAAARVDASVDRAYGLALRLVLITIGAAGLAVLLVRAVPRRSRGTAA
jgi:hypothetical protein